jgi:hypothetical protein
MAPNAKQLLEEMAASIPLMPEMSPREEEYEMEVERFEGTNEEEEEEQQLVGEAANPQYSQLVDRLFSSVRRAAEGSKAKSTLDGYRGYVQCFTGNSRYY